VLQSYRIYTGEKRTFLKGTWHRVTSWKFNVLMKNRQGEYIVVAIINILDIFMLKNKD